MITGDIAAMWFRDSYNQVEPYLRRLHADPEVRAMLRGLLRYQAALLMLDPYPNAYYAEPQDLKPYQDTTTRLLFSSPLPLVQGLVHERKFEVDSPSFFVKLVNEYHAVYRDPTLLDARLVRALRAVRQLVYQQMDDKRRQALQLPLHYSFARKGFPDELSNGTGAGGGTCGLVRSGFRPSDDPVRMPYNVPGNSLLATELRKLALGLLADCAEAGRTAAAQLQREFLQVSVRLESSLKGHAVVRVRRGGESQLVYAQEVDCEGGFVLGDDPNLPSLMSLPLYNFTVRLDPIWQNTKSFLYSPANSLHFRQAEVHGLGSTHTPARYIWPIGILTRLLTSDDSDEVRQCLAMLLLQADRLMHESFSVDHPAAFTRGWFAWANSMFAGALLALAEGTHARLVLRD